MHIDATYRSEHRLNDGTLVLVRAIRPSDADGLRRGFARLSPQSRFRRFLVGMPELSDAMVRYLTQVDYVNHFAVVATDLLPEGREGKGLGVARFIRLPEDPDVAEAAVTVVDQAHGKGVGRCLLSVLVQAAEERGVKMLRAEVLPSNMAVRHLVEGFGGQARMGTGGTMVVEVPISLT